MSAVKQGTSKNFHNDLSTISEADTPIQTMEFTSSSHGKANFNTNTAVKSNISPKRSSSASSATSNQLSVQPPKSGVKANQFEIPEATKTYTHIKEYPIANSWIRIAGYVPAPHVVRSRLYQTVYSPPMRDYTMSVDDVIDQYLNQVDETIPAFRTLRMRDIRDTLTDPFTTLASRMYESANSFAGLFNKQVSDPARSFVQDVRKSYAPLHDTQGRPLIRSQIDPLLKPVNTRVEALINRRYNGIGDPISSPYTNELAHSRKLISNGMSRGTRSLSIRVSNFNGARSNIATEHIGQLYESNKEKRGDQGRFVVMIASMDTARDILNEMSNRSGVNPLSGDGTVNGNHISHDAAPKISSGSAFPSNGELPSHHSGSVKEVSAATLIGNVNCNTAVEN
ncbi:unnamed protein product [Ambrosiozyma monospora]|uniref:Unnamed protein product n=1 Tax=Ambrosiozyma monospora TaxID=43982 RepID=A0A9W6YWY7_AMBMO|nr:unnamed protein product [Ambrosiozyma monospora]